MFFDFELLLRVILSGICGVIIGYERKTRGKGAGVRTHMIVALAASLMMVISKYGFTDMADVVGSRGADSSRIASQIVSGVGFLGAGMIYVHKNSINGLTTAAGIWATSGIGMAVGAGMYFIGIATTAVIFISQIILHKNLKFMQMPQEASVTISVLDTPEAVSFINERISGSGWQIDKLKTKRHDGLVDISMDMTVPAGFNPKDYLEIIENDSYIQAVEIQ
ncbi:MAG: MgtC/SapB family protein [Clostridia bacterium]|nr:MgtC/SapB family protein [Clostridia bacterium]